MALTGRRKLCLWTVSRADARCIVEVGLLLRCWDRWAEPPMWETPRVADSSLAGSLVSYKTLASFARRIR